MSSLIGIVSKMWQIYTIFLIPHNFLLFFLTFFDNITKNRYHPIIVIPHMPNTLYALVFN